MEGEGCSLTAVLLYLFKYFSCSPSLFLPFDFLRYSTFILVTPSSFSPPASLPYLSGSWGCLENTYIISAASVPTGGKSTDGLDRETSEGKAGSAALGRGQGRRVTLTGTFFQGQPPGQASPQTSVRLPLLCSSIRNHTFHWVFVFP